MNIIIEKLSVIGLAKPWKEIKLPKGKLLVTIGSNKFMVNNTEPNPETIKQKKTETDEK